MNKIKCSVIIPCYNAEKYLNNCVSSLVSNADRFLEVIIIDDGSADRTHDICLMLSDKYSNVHFYTYDNDKWNNKGQGEARNLGVTKATGEWIVFLDVDDYLNIDELFAAISTAEDCGADIAFYDFSLEFRNTSVVYTSSIDEKKYDTKEFISFWGSRIRWEGFSCIGNKAYKREFIFNRVFFRDGFKFNEDILFFFDVLSFQPQICYCARVVYKYNQINNSYNNACKKGFYRYSDRLLNQMMALLEEYNLMDSLLWLVHYRRLKVVCYVINDNLIHGSLKKALITANKLSAKQEVIETLEFNQNSSRLTMKEHIFNSLLLKRRIMMACLCVFFNDIIYKMRFKRFLQSDLG